MEQVVTIGRTLWSMKGNGEGKLVTLTPLEGYATYSRIREPGSAGKESGSKAHAGEKP